MLTQSSTIDNRKHNKKNHSLRNYDTIYVGLKVDTHGTCVVLFGAPGNLEHKLRLRFHGRPSWCQCLSRVVALDSRPRC